MNISLFSKTAGESGDKCFDAGASSQPHLLGTTQCRKSGFLHPIPKTHVCELKGDGSFTYNVSIRREKTCKEKGYSHTDFFFFFSNRRFC